MTIAPHNGDSIVSFALHVGWIDILWHFIYLKDLTSVNLIDATGASALDSKFVWVDSLSQSHLARPSSV